MEDGRSSHGLELDQAGGCSRGLEGTPGSAGSARDSCLLDWLDVEFPVFPAS